MAQRDVRGGGTIDVRREIKESLSRGVSRSEIGGLIWLWQSLPQELLLDSDRSLR